MSEQDDDVFQRSWAALNCETLAPSWRAGESLRPRSVPPEGAGVARLPSWELASTPTQMADLELGRTLGEGGLGLVLEGRQVALERMVAVKCLRDPNPSADANARLMREARVMAALEHPNIVSVHGLGRAPGGQPLVMMARVDGVTWRTQLQERMPWAAVDSAPLERGLRVLMQVCQAIHFAHDRGYLHLDLKPDNVMLGAYGEVYVVDWGLATLSAGATTTQLTGTPAYMAPEMARPGAPLNARSDVYLLGAMLHELVSGRPPHRGDSLHAVLKQVHQNARTELGGVPAELARIVRRALADDPADRYASADALRRAINDFLTHRDARAITERAQGHQAQLLSALAADAAAPRIDERFGAARFGFEEALRAWPESAAAQAGLQATIEAMIMHDLERGQYRAARRLLVDLPEPRPALTARADEVAALDATEQAALTQLRADAVDRDPGIGLPGRVGIVSVMAVPLGIAPIVMGGLRRAGVLPAEVPPFNRMIAPLVAGLILFAYARWSRHRVLSSGHNRRLVWVGAALLIGAAFGWVLAAALSLPFATTVAGNLGWAAAGSLLASFILDARLLLAAGGLAAGALGAALMPTYAEDAMGLANLMALLGLAFAWRRSGARRRAGRPPV